MTEHTAGRIIDGQPLDFHALRAVVFDSIRGSLEREGWETDDSFGFSPLIIEFEGHKIKIAVDLLEMKEGIRPKDPALLAAKEALKERRRQALEDQD
ncbi:hypothetical protein [Streptomyces sp. NPDC004008]